MLDPCWVMVYSLDVEKDVGLLVEDWADVAHRDRRVVHLVPLTVAGLSQNTEEHFDSISENEMKR